MTMTPPPAPRFTVPPAWQGKGLLPFLRESLGTSSRQTKALLDQRRVFVNGKRVWMAKHPLRKGDVVECPGASPPDRKPASADGLEILYRDEWLLAVNKPAGRISDRGKESVEALLRQQEKEPGLRALHRLDRDTSGLLMFLRVSEVRENYLTLFRTREIQKTYLCLLAGNPEGNLHTLRRRLDGKSAESVFRVLGRKGNFCKAECDIATGRTHQIRRHALELGCRVAGDRQYGQQLPLSPVEKSLPRQMLHALSVRFTCPQSGKPLHIHAPPPKDFQQALNQLGLR